MHVYMLVTLINYQRQQDGLPMLGFLNPTLYSAGAAGLFNDVTIGTNKCYQLPVFVSDYYACCTEGFNATVGWDPVTGLGSVNFPNLAKITGTPYPTPMPSSAPTRQHHSPNCKTPTKMPSGKPTSRPT